MGTKVVKSQEIGNVREFHGAWRVVIVLVCMLYTHSPV